MIHASAFIEPLRALGYSLFTGVPCSFLRPFINHVINDHTLDYLGATNEAEAVGIAAGAFLGGRKSVVMCQNSGLGNMVNPLTSLNYPFRIPALLIITWRGEPAHPDEPQHELMGQITHQLLETMRIPWLPFPTDESQIADVICQAEKSMHERQLPFALVMSDGSVMEPDSESPSLRKPETSNIERRTSNVEPPPAEFIAPTKPLYSNRSTRTEALQAILEALAGNEAILATTGKIGRELFAIADRPNHLYVIGAMGTASSIGFGLAYSRPQQPVVVLDGDGAALMHLGSLGTIGFYRPSNLLHIVLDNESHDSTGGQQTVSAVLRFTEMALAANYRCALAANNSHEIKSAVRELRRIPGPSLLHVKIRPGSPQNLPRPKLKPHQVKDRFIRFLAES